VRRVLARYENKWAELPAKWTPEENIHITLVFLGDMNDVQVGEICMIAKEVASKHSAIDIALNHVGYGPDNKVPPKMVWASGEKNPALSALKKELEEALLEKVHFVPEKRGFSPHVTLARITAFAWRAIEPEERPEVNELTDLLFTAESIEVMESEMGKGGPHYTIIESIQLS
jgi:2'-5' RNA ligase